MNGNGTTAIEKGQSAFDTVHTSNATPDAGGTVTYGLDKHPTCSTLVADLTPANNTVVNGVAPNSLSHTFNATGHFWFQATYSGDA